ncbi:MAG TPA: fumarate hydratase [Firmicutes bacterium]|nr:fumarate hydratase [Bacillota bacterium]
MREIQADVIRDAVEELFIRANLELPPDVYTRLAACAAAEQGTLASGILHKLVENADIAKKDSIPICQDTGMAFVFADVGQDVHITGGLFEDAVNAGVANAYEKGYLRKSVVSCPLERINTGDNTPAVIYTRLCAGDRVRLLAMPKGFGSENMSRIQMFNPTASTDEIIEFVYETVYQAGGNPCPPLVIGIGLGGSFDYAAVLAKKALAREVGVHNARYRELEERILRRVNESGVGPSGLGGDTTALWAAVEAYPTHIAGLPVAVNISCHATRHAEKII